MGQPERADHQSARPAAFCQRTAQVEVQRDHRRQYAVQRPAAHPRLREARFLGAQGRRRRRCGGTETRRRALARSHRGLRHRSLRSHRNFSRCLLRTARRPVGWHDRPAGFIDRGQHPQRGFRRTAAMGWAVRHRALHRRDLRTRPAGDEGLLEQPGRNGTHLAGRLAEDRRHRLHGHPRLRAHHRSQEGHDSRLRLQRLSQRSRKRRCRAPRRRRMRGNRRTG